MTSTDGPAARSVAAAQAGSASAAARASTDEPREMVPDTSGTDGGTAVTPHAPAPWRALLAEAAAKSDLVWVRRRGERRAWPAWHVWHDDAVHVVSGAGEQVLPPLDGPVDLLVRSKDTWQRLLTVPALASTLGPDDDRWAAAAAALAAARLNASVPPAQLPQVWSGGSATITRIEATGPPTEQPGDYDDTRHAAPPPATPAARSGWRPWHAGGRLRRHRRLRRRG